jgi:Fe2+ or Zn2+ uptake regulation protein
MEKIKELLAAKELKPTIQRIKIYQYMIEHRTHPDVEAIYNDLVKEIPTISKATIYNTLKELIKRGLILEIPTEDKLYFDGHTQPHCHFICEECGKIYDLTVELCFGKRRKVNGHLVKKISVALKGICAECQEEGRVKS